MDYILSGKDKEVAKVIQENRVRVNRGLVSFTPMTETVHTDNSEVIANLIEENQTLKAENQRLQDELNKSTQEATGQPTVDDKNVDLEDLQEVDLDDNKEVIVNDTKDVSEDDDKAISADDTPKSSKRTKK
ncbi:MAG: DNA replication initiation control protein YabA [Bacteroidales bacterium]|nr:DNA replication initiation control protein YabA [Bacteroidales bacterium]